MDTPTPPDDDFVDFTWWDHALHKQHTRVRRSLLGHPTSCTAEGDPRYLRASVALTRCGHVSTGPMDIRGYDVHLAPRGIAWCEGAGHAHAPHAWGRVCSGPGDLATLRASWLALGRCWGIGVEASEPLEPLEPGTRFGPAWPSLHVYRVTTPAHWMGRRGALGVGTGGITPRFSARNVPRAGFIRHLVPLGLMLHDSLVSGVFPAERSLEQQRALLRETWTAVLEAWLFKG